MFYLELLDFAELKDTLQQLEYTNVQKGKLLNVYTALDRLGEKTTFQVIREGKSLRIINTYILENMTNKKDMQLIDIEFISDLGFRIYVNDFIKGKQYNFNTVEELNVQYHI